MRIERPDREPDLAFQVVGQPKGAGSKDPHMHVSADGPKMWVSDNAGPAGKEWRAAIAYVASRAMDGRALFDLETPLYVELTVLRGRGGGHFGQGRNAGKLLPSAPLYPHTKPDAVKLARALEDALTGVVWQDDSRNAVVHVEKVYAEPGEPTGAHVRIWTLPSTLGRAQQDRDQLSLGAVA
jgi:Holliday junction resolvase RusA-like endonuclease